MTLNIIEINVNNIDHESDESNDFSLTIDLTLKAFILYTYDDNNESFILYAFFKTDECPLSFMDSTKKGTERYRTKYKIESNTEWGKSER